MIIAEEEVEEAGIFSWCMDGDTLYGDTAVAALFGLDPIATVKGLPLTDYMARVAAADRQMVAGLISKAVEDGQPYRVEYRVIGKDRRLRWIMATGRCFRNKNGNPVNYSGIVYPIDKLVLGPFGTAEDTYHRDNYDQ